MSEAAARLAPPDSDAQLEAMEHLAGVLGDGLALSPASSSFLAWVLMFNEATMAGLAALVIDVRAGVLSGQPLFDVDDPAVTAESVVEGVLGLLVRGRR